MCCGQCGLWKQQARLNLTNAFKGSATLNAALGPLEAAGQLQSGTCEAFKGFAALNIAMGWPSKKALFTADAGGRATQMDV